MRTADACDLYLRLKHHFTDPEFDYFDTTKSPLTYQHYVATPSKFSLERLARHADPRDYLVYNFVSYGDVTLEEVMKGGKYDITYLTRKKINESLTYSIKIAASTYDLSPKYHKFPDLLLELYLNKKISLEIYLVLTKIYGITPTNTSDKTTVKILKYLERKYLPFISYNTEKIMDVVHNATTNAT